MQSPPSLLIVRHGIAEPGGAGGDRERALTVEGVEALRRACGGLLRLGVAPRRVVTSPLVRTVQTGDLLREGLAVEAPAVVLEELAPGAEPAAVLRVLAPLAREGLTVLVGHMPDVVAMTRALVAPGAPAANGYAPGTMALVELSAGLVLGGGRMRWHHTAAELGGGGLGEAGR